MAKFFLKIIYNLITGLASLYYVNHYKALGKTDRSYLEHLGEYPENQHHDKSIWVHCASVGEAKIGAVLIKGVRRIDDKTRIVLTVKTAAGRQTAQDLAGDLAEVRYCPYDLTKYVRRAFRYINPRKLVLMETELWPNLLSAAVRSGTKLYLVNGRISDKSYGYYRLFSTLLLDLLQQFKLSMMQSEKDCQRIVELGMPKSRCEVVNNLKYDLMRGELQKINPVELRRQLGIDSNQKFIIAGSIRADEDKYVLEAFNGLLQTYPDLKLIIAPRHLERIPQIEGRIREYNLNFIKRSEMTAESLKESQILILDTMGELTALYSISTAAFVGGSLCGRGGQNPLEPVGLGIPTCFGPSMENFDEISKSLLDSNLAVQINSSDDMRTFFSGVIEGKINPPDSARIFEKYGGGAEHSAARIME